VHGILSPRFATLRRIIRGVSGDSFPCGGQGGRGDFEIAHRLFADDREAGLDSLSVS